MTEKNLRFLKEKTTLLSELGFGFSKDNKTIYYYDSTRFNKFYSLIDFPSFELMAGNKNTWYFRDKNHIYLDSYMSKFSIIEGADPLDFEVTNIKKGYSHSGNNDFCYSSKLSFLLKEVIPITNSYQRVKGKVYFGYTHLVNCDSDTFNLLDSREQFQTIFKDKDHVFHKGEIIEGADPETFHFLEECIGRNASPYLECDIHYYAVDKNYAYFVNSPHFVEIIKTKDLANFRFEVIGGIGYGFDSSYKYEKGRRRPLKK